MRDGASTHARTAPEAAPPTAPRPTTTPPPTTTPSRSRPAATRAALIAAARDRFAEAGYHATGTHEVVALASVTRGALYHHFCGKEALFEAVFLQVQEEIERAARAAVAPLSGDTWSQLTGAFSVLLRLQAESAEAQRILMIDGPAVLGWERWRALQADTLKGTVQTLQMLMDPGVIARRPPGPLAHLIVSALSEAALCIAHAPQPQGALSLHADALLALLEGLRIAR